MLMTTVPTDVRRSYANRLTDDLVASGDITDADWRGAFAAPSSRDWTAALGEVASGTALESVRRDVENYASFPAHTEGVISRAPAVGEASEGRVEIVDCVELGDSRLIADTTEEVLDDLANRTPRYRFRAGVLLQDGRWLVDVTNPALDEPC
ncbi:MAG: hypothetical protein ACRDRK_01305 [Pseudonocardia sp.]